MLNIELNQELVPEKDRLSDAVLKSIELRLKEQVKKLPNGIIAASFISEDKMKGLNKQYRDKNTVTDVLSFSYLEDGVGETVGDIVISYDQAKRQEKEGMNTELVTLLVHGALHVLGYDHEKPKDAKIMFPMQDKIVQDVL